MFMHTMISSLGIREQTEGLECYERWCSNPPTRNNGDACIQAHGETVWLEIFGN